MSDSVLSDNVRNSIVDKLREEVNTKKVVDVGSGVEKRLGSSISELRVAIHMLRTEGYVIRTFQLAQSGTDVKTTIKVLTNPYLSQADVIEIYKEGA